MLLVLTISIIQIFLAGLALQLASFFCFTVLYMRFLYRMYKYEPETWRQDGDKTWYQDWRSLAGALFVSCLGVLVSASFSLCSYRSHFVVGQVRSIYRTIELSEGYQGHLTTTESYFYLLDLLPLLVALVVYIPFWPGRFIPNTVPVGEPDDIEEKHDKLGEGTLTEGEGALGRGSKSSTR